MNTALRTHQSALVAVTLVVGGACGSGDAGTPEGGAQPSPTVSVDGTFDVGGNPLDVASTEDVVWVSLPQDERVAVVVPATGRVATTADVEGGSPSALALDGRMVWTGRNGLVTVDTEGKVVGRFSPAEAMQDLVVGLDSLWVTAMEDDVVVRVDRDTKDPIAKIPVGETPAALAVTKDAVWVAPADTQMVQKIDPGSNRVVADVQLPANPVALAASGSDLFVVVQQESGSGNASVVAIDTKDGSTRWTVPVGRGPGISPGVGGGRLFVPNLKDDTVSIIDTKTGKLTQTLSVGPSPTAVTVSGNLAWVTNYGVEEDNDDNLPPVRGSVMRLRL